MDQKLKRLLQQDMEKEADHITEMLANLPEEEKEDLPKAEYMDVLARLQEFAETEAKFEAERKSEKGAQAGVAEVRPAGDTSHLSSEEQELIRLGTIYKKRRNWNRLAILVAALVCVLSLGLTATGGPEKLFEEIRWKLAGREQTNIDSDDDRVVEPDDVSENEAYEKIDEVFGFYPVKLYYLPEGMQFSKISIDDIMQNAQIVYKSKRDEVISYVMYPDYRTSSTTSDIEEYLVEEKQVIVNNIVVTVKKYYEVEEKQTRWSADFNYLDVHYSLLIIGLEEEEMEKIVENLYFS